VSVEPPEWWRDPTPWADQALCAQTDPELFFPPDQMMDRYMHPGGRGIRKDLVDAARKICRECPVQAECLEYALRYDNLHGIWGGTTPNQRTRLRRKQTPA